MVKIKLKIPAFKAGALSRFLHKHRKKEVSTSMKYYESRYKYYYTDDNTKTRETKVVITDISNGGTE